MKNNKKLSLGCLKRPDAFRAVARYGLSVVFFVAAANATASSKPRVAVYPTDVGSVMVKPQERSLDASLITETVSAALRSTRRFQLYERKDAVLSDVVMKEQAFAQSGFAVGDSAEMGKLQDVGLIVRPTVTEFRFGSAFHGLDGFPGKYKRTDYGLLAVDFKILDSTTAEIKYQATRKASFEKVYSIVDGRHGGPGKAEWVALVEDVAHQAANHIVSSIFPVTVMKYAKNRLYLNRGEGSGIEQGQKWTLFSTGESLIDPVTGENLGAESIPIGKVKIVQVTSKYSVAEPVGQLDDKPKTGDVVIR